MTIKSLTNEQLVEKLKERTCRLAQFLDLSGPPIAITREIGLIVDAARQLYGREVVDADINRYPAITQALEAGKCSNCLDAPVLKEDELGLCDSCRKYHLKMPN
jgi:hypothetical protein